MGTPKPKSVQNAELNALPEYRDKACFLCGRKYPETVLNIEGYLHHGTGLACIATKKCSRLQRKKGRQ